MGCCGLNIEENNEKSSINNAGKQINYNHIELFGKGMSKEDSNENKSLIKINEILNEDCDNMEKSLSSEKENLSESIDISEIFPKKIDYDEIKKQMEYIIEKNFIFFILIFGKNFQKIYLKFLIDFNHIYELARELKTSYYTLSYEKVKEIIDGINDAKITENGLYDKKLYELVGNFPKKIKKVNHINIYKLLSENKDLQIELIIAYIKNLLLYENFNKNNFSFLMIRYLQDIGFCFRIINNSLYEILYQDEFIGYEHHLDLRMLFFMNMLSSSKLKSDFPQDLLQYATESARVKDTIIIGNQNFRNHIRGLNIPCERINELDDIMFDSFFKNPYKAENKYKITKYFIICEKELERKYLDLFKCLSAKYGFGFLFLVYKKNKDIVEEKYDLKKIKPIIYIYEDFELIEIYKDNNIRLKANLDKLLSKNFSKAQLKMNDLVERIIYKNIKDFKYNCEDGWDIFENENNINNDPFKLKINISYFHDFIDLILGNIIQSYKENNALEIFFKYYSNYFFLTLQPEFIINMTAYAKMFLYAYTLDEGDPNKNLYCIINNDLRSSIPEKVNRHFDLIKLIGGLIINKSLKSYNNIVYRATFLKDELIQKIKIGQTMINSAFWSSTKKESVSKTFLEQNHKNCLIITEGGLNNNVDIHSEEISKYPEEEEVLFLPFCTFKIKSFDKVNEGNKWYYKLVLDKNSDSSIIKPFDEEIIDSLDFKLRDCLFSQFQLILN